MDFIFYSGKKKKKKRTAKNSGGIITSRVKHLSYLGNRITTLCSNIMVTKAQLNEVNSK